MRKEYDFRFGKRGAVVRSAVRTRIRIMLDGDDFEAFRVREIVPKELARARQSEPRG